MDFFEFYERMRRTNQLVLNHWGQRRGQWYFNQLADIRPYLANKVTGTKSDPFYNDENIPAFWDFVVEHWED